MSTRQFVIRTYASQEDMQGQRNPVSVQTVNNHAELEIAVKNLTTPFWNIINRAGVQVTRRTANNLYLQDIALSFTRIQ